MKLNILLVSLPMLVASVTACHSDSTNNPSLNRTGVVEQAVKDAGTTSAAAQPEAQRRPAVAYSYVVKGQRYNVLKSAQGYNQEGKVSWYGPGFDKHKAANGSIYNMHAMTAASKVLPLNTYVKVTNLQNHRSVVVKVTDRGPFVTGRIMDLSYAAAQKLQIVHNGTGFADVQAITSPSVAV